MTYFDVLVFAKYLINMIHLYLVTMVSSDILKLTVALPAIILRDVLNELNHARSKCTKLYLLLYI